MAEDEKPRDVQAFLALARKRFEQDASDEAELRKEAELDFRFEAGDQWDEKVRADRAKAGRPALTFNRTHTFVQQVSNEARQNKPQIKFVPAEDGDKETAEIYEGLARHIQYSSEAAEAYENAAECAAAGSFGYFRFLTEYCDDESFDLDVKVVPVHDPFSVYGVLYPSCFGLEPNHAFVVTNLPKEEFEAMYPDAEVLGDWDGATKDCGDWVGTDTIRVAEYWTVEETTKELKKGDKKRTVREKKVKFYKTNGFEILEETEWPGYCIPIFPVLGKKRVVNGKPVLYSVIRFQRDPQKLINFYKTRIAETLGTAPIQPYMIAEGQLPNDPQYRAMWEQLNTSLKPYLVYKPTDVDGRPVDAPKRQVFEAPIQSLSEAALQEIEDMKATTGIYDASLGAKSNENSGIAIQRRQQQSDITNMHFMDNLGRSFQKGGSVLAEVIPAVYDGARTARILGKDEEPKIVKINQEFVDASGNKKHYKIGGDGVAKYDVVVTMERAYSTKRLESFDMISQVIASNPDTLPMVGDILFKNSDVAGADQLAERFKKMLPPQLQEPEDGQVEIPEQVKAQISAMQEDHAKLNAYAQKVEEENKQYKAGIQAKQLETDSREAIELAKLSTQKEIVLIQEETKRMLAEINTKSQDLRERMKLDADLDTKMRVQEHAQAHEVGMAAAAAGHETAMTDKQAEHTQNQQATQIEADQQAAKIAAKAKPKPKQ